MTRRLSPWSTAAVLPIALLMACSASEDKPSSSSTTKAGAELVGSWTATVTKQDLRRVVPDFPKQHLCDNAGTFDWTFNADGTFVIDQTQLPDCPKPEVTHIEDRWSVDGDQVRFTNEQEVYTWRVNEDQLTFEHVSGGCIPCKAINTANPWTRAD
jgi:hypothetical protein